MDVERMRELAERAEKAGSDIVCPFCGEADFDLPGLSVHIFGYCEVDKLAALCRGNSDLAASLRALSQEQPNGE